MKEPVRSPTPIHAAVAGFSGRAPDMAPFTTNGNVCCHQAMYIIAIIYKYKYMEINQSWYIYVVYFGHLHQVNVYLLKHQDLPKPLWLNVYTKLCVRYNGDGITVCSYCESYVMSAGLEPHYSTE